MRIHLFVIFFLCLANSHAQAHKPSDSYLKLDVAGNTIAGQWDIALRDLDFAVGLDSNQDGAITWGEVKARHGDIDAYAMSRLQLGAEAAPCKSDVKEHLVDSHSDGTYAVIRFVADCPQELERLSISYRLFSEIDPTHRGLLNLTANGNNQASIFSPETADQTFTLGGLSIWASFAGYFLEGIIHIWSGLDHMMFLSALLLPAFFYAAPKAGSNYVHDLKLGVIEVLKVITAFTLSHAITLSVLAATSITVPSRIVESAIAATVFLTALHNVRPVVKISGSAIGFAFGLVHGFGFASILGGLGLEKNVLLVALAGFNIGVEAGQLALAILFLPIAAALLHKPGLRRSLLVAGSLIIAAMASVWFCQRAFNTVIIPGFV
jgi:HupE / UreJ protein